MLLAEEGLWTELMGHTGDPAKSLIHGPCSEKDKAKAN